MYDTSGYIYRDKGHFFDRLEPIPSPSESHLFVKDVPILISVIQHHSNRYYHFVVEILPRIIAIRKYLNIYPTAKLLIWENQPILRYLDFLGIPRNRIEPFDPSIRYGLARNNPFLSLYLILLHILYFKGGEKKTKKKYPLNPLYFFSCTHLPQILC